MKLHRFYLAFLLGIILTFFYACSKNDSVSTSEITLTVDHLTFSSNEEIKTVYIKSNVSWTIESTQPWCMVSPTSGNAGNNPVKVKLEQNDQLDIREAIISIDGGGIEKQIQVQQERNYILSLESSTFDVSTEGGEIDVKLQVSDPFNVTINGDWITKKLLKSIKDSTETYIVAPNNKFVPRNGTITYTLNEKVEIVTIMQAGKDPLIPSDKIGVESDAMTLAGKMIAGWNIGNSLEVPEGEVGWGNPVVTKQLIDGVKAAGFNAIRIPCAWDSYIIDRETYEISDTWFARVKEVVDYCYTNDMYAILNIHWDGGWLENNPTSNKQEEINKKQFALWQQIAEYFNDYDERLLFAGTNEVHVEGVYGTPSTENITVQQSFNQTFVEAVRSSGGKNSYRNLVVQTFNTNIANGVNYHQMPIDIVPNRLMLEVHYYDPWDFCGETTEENIKTQWGKGYTDVSSWGQEDYLNEQFASMKTNFSDIGIPVILGEYGAMLRANLKGDVLAQHKASRNYYLKTVTSAAKANGMVPFIWDNGVVGNNGFGLFDRSTGNEIHSDAIDAIIEGVTN